MSVREKAVIATCLVGKIALIVAVFWILGRLRRDIDHGPWRTDAADSGAVAAAIH